MSELFDELSEALQPRNLFPISKNIPLPKRKESPEHHFFPLHLMDIGDSFQASDIYKQVDASKILAQVSSWAFKQGNEYKFVVRKFNGGIRVWRVE